MKWQTRVESPRNIGIFTEDDARDAQAIFVVAKGGEKEDGESIVFYLLVDPLDGVILDARFCVFGPPELIGVGDLVCELLVHKNYGQIRRMDAKSIEGLCGTSNPIVLCALQQAVEACKDIPLATPVLDYTQEEKSYPGWELLSKQEHLVIVKEVIEKEIAPYIALDAGGVRVLDIVDGKEVKIAYEGTCTSCPSATGSTLDAMQHILRTKVHSALVVVPDIGYLT